MVLFKVSSKRHTEKAGDVHAFKVELKCKEGHKLTLDVNHDDFEGWQIGDSIDVKWGQFQQDLSSFQD